jgi:hypothetical protein
LDVEPDQKQVIADWLLGGVIAGRINSRQDVRAALAVLGEITRTSDNYFSVRLKPDAKPLRLKGSLFDKSFDANATRHAQSAPKTVVGNARETLNHEAAAEARADLEATIRRRAAYNRNRYRCPSPAAQALSEATQNVKAQVAALRAQQARDAVRSNRAPMGLPSPDPEQQQEVPHDGVGNDAAAAAREFVERVQAAVRSTGRALERLRNAALAAVAKGRALDAIGRALDAAVERFERATRIRIVRRNEELERFKRDQSGRKKLRL